MKIEVIVSTDRLISIITGHNKNHHTYNGYSSIHQFMTRLSVILQGNFLGAEVLVTQGYDSIQHQVVTTSPNADVKLRVSQIIAVTENNPGSWLVEDRSGDVAQIEEEAKKSHDFALGMTDGNAPIFRFDSLTRKSEDTAWALYRNENGDGFIIAHLEDDLIDGWEPISLEDLREFCNRALIVTGE